MANITITVQSLLNVSVYDSYTVSNTTTISSFKSTIQTNTGCDPSWFGLVFNNELITDETKTLAYYNIINGSVLRTANQIARLATLEDRQIAKLDLAALDREASGNARKYYDLTELPTYYVGNTITDNPNSTGLIEGRPWTDTPVTPPTVVQDGLLAYYDPNNAASYSGSGATLNDLMGGSPATLGGTYSYSTAAIGTSLAGYGTIRLQNTSGVGTSNVSRINCPSLTGIRTVSFWYYQYSALATRYILDTRPAGGYVYIGGEGGVWSGGTSFINGGASQSITFVETLNQWINITFVATAGVTDAMNIFSRFSNNEALDVSFGQIMIYNRALTEAENRQNFNVYKARYGM